MKNLVNILKILIFVVLIIILSIIRITLVKELPIFAYIDYIDDDELMIQQAKSIISGNWLGVYGYNTLLKGPVFPLFLALIHELGLSYIFSITSVYVIGCILFIYSIKDIVKNKIWLLIVFIFILFNPIMYSISFQRVYRNSLAPSLALILISCYNILLINSNSKKILEYIIFEILFSIVFPFFYFIREDSIWIIPFIIFYTIIILIKLSISIFRKRQNVFKGIIKILLLLLPIGTYFTFILIIGNINYQYYSANVVDQRSFQSLNEAITSINKVKNVGNDITVSNNREKIKMLYEISPALNSIKSNFEHYLDVIAGGENGEVSDGMFLWAFLGGVQASGYNTFQKQDKLFKEITMEIEEAIKSKKIDTQELMPFFNDSLKYRFDISNFLENFWLSNDVVNDYGNLKLMDTYGSLFEFSDFYEVRIKMFMELTNDKLLLNDTELARESFEELIKINQKDYMRSQENKVSTLNKINDLYENIEDSMQIIGIASYIIITVLLIICMIRNGTTKLLDDWIILSGIVGSIVTIYLGIAYTATLKVDVCVPFYLMSAFVLNNIFTILGITILIDCLIVFIKSKIKKEEY